MAVDADPDANLGMALAFVRSSCPNTTIAQDEKLIAERTGTVPGEFDSWLTLNPFVEDIPEKYVVKQGNISLLQMGTKSIGGTGCACPESILLKYRLNHLVVERNEAVIVDMEAGLEHLGRGTAEGVDAFINCGGAWTTQLCYRPGCCQNGQGVKCSTCICCRKQTS